MNPDIASIARDPSWLPHRYDPQYDAVHFIRLDRAGHRAATFLTDDELPKDAARLVLTREETVAAAMPTRAPIHWIFHSAYCCSTLLSRALDREGIAMSLKEPVILNDIVGWRRRKGEPPKVARALDGAMTLMAQPFSPGEAVVVKPSNIVNGLGRAILAMRPDSRAVLLHAPLRTYLASIAKKGLWGRVWVREFFTALLKDGLADIGFDEEAYFGQSDLQIAAAGWLIQHRIFARLIEEYGAGRVRSLDSETLTARPADALAALAALYDLPLGDAEIAEIVAGPAFTRHSKSNAPFDAAGRANEHREASTLHGEEIEQVAIWAEAVAASQGISLRLEAPLLP